MQDSKWVTKRRVLLRTLVFVAIAAGCQAASLVDLVPKADAIVVGSAFGRTDSGQVITFSLAVEQSLKGTLRPGTILNMRWQSWSPSNQTYGTASWRGVWFLAQTKENGFELIPVRMGKKAFFNELFYQLSTQLPPPELAGDAAATLSDKIILQLATSAAYDANDQVLEAAAVLDSETIRNAFRFIAAQSTVRSKAIGLAGLIARNDVAALSQFETVSPTMSGADLELPITAIRVWFRNPDNLAVAGLGRLAKVGAEASRDAAVAALSAIHTAAAVPVLASLLYDQSESRQQSAVRGLAAFANGLAIQTVSNTADMAYMPVTAPSGYRSADTEKYSGTSSSVAGDPAMASASSTEAIAFWKGWWQQHQAEF